MKCHADKLLGCAALQVCAAVAYSSLDHNCVARTNDQIFGGHYSTQQTSVCEWLGIPYAEAPVGGLRFAPPVKPLSSNSSYDAASYVSHSSKTMQVQTESDRFLNLGL